MRDEVSEGFLKIQTIIGSSFSLKNFLMKKSCLCFSQRECVWDGDALLLENPETLASTGMVICKGQRLMGCTDHTGSLSWLGT
jgi:hypothetical protein